VSEANLVKGWGPDGFAERPGERDVPPDKGELMRLLLACLLLVVLGCGDDDSSSPDAGAGAAASGGAGASGRPGGPAVAGSGGQSASGMTGGAGHPGSGGAGGESGSSGTGGAGAGAKLGMIRLVPNVVAGKQNGSGGSGGVGSQQSALRVGSPNATTLLSLKYYITSIQLCEDLELAGSGFTNTKGCIYLYQNLTANSPDYNEYTVMDAKDDNTEGRYIDLMSSEGQAALRKPVMVQVPIAEAPPVDATLDSPDGGADEAPPQQAGVYRYGLINFYRPIKVKAEFPIIGETSDHYFRTKAVTAIHETPAMNGGFNSDRVDIGDTLNGATEETTYMLNNGGALFVFQKPFAITQADIDAKAEINIDLVFNPESFGQAYVTMCEADLRVVVCDPVNNVSIDMPYVRMNPVPRKTGEKTHKETYLVDYDANAKVRLELYYNDGDGQAGIQGVDTAVVYGATAPTGDVPSFNTIASNFVSQSGSVMSNDASVSLLDYQHRTNLEGLRRRQAGTVTLHCLFTGSICTTLNETLTRAYTYEGDTIVSGN
jgi:hypothetical protein